MRAIPELVVLVWVFFAIPILTGISLPSFWAALVALTIQVAAYVSEIVRSGLGSIRQGQTNAGLALGMSMPQILFRILLPQALVRMIPPYNTIISMTIKDTAIASMIAVPELMRRSETLASQSYRPVEVFTTALILYFCLLFPVTRLVEIAYRRLQHLGRS